MTAGTETLGDGVDREKHPLVCGGQPSGAGCQPAGHLGMF
jgi:hypothetical protein